MVVVIIVVVFVCCCLSYGCTRGWSLAENKCRISPYLTLPYPRVLGMVMVIVVVIGSDSRKLSSKFSQMGSILAETALNCFILKK